MDAKPNIERNADLAILQLNAAIAEFEATQEKYDEFGADDTEPCYEFHLLLKRVWLLAEDINAQIDADSWQLYTVSMDCKEAGRELGVSAQKVIDILKSPLDMSQRFEINQRLKEYCWRVDW